MLNKLSSILINIAESYRNARKNYLQIQF